MNSNPSHDIDQNEDDLEYTRGIRKRLIRNLALKEDSALEGESLSALRELLNDQDRVSVARLRIKVEKKNSDSQSELAASLAMLLKNPNVKNSRVGEISAMTLGAPELPKDAANPEVVHGEFDDIGSHTEDYNQFMNRIQGDGINQKPGAA